MALTLDRPGPEPAQIVGLPGSPQPPRSAPARIFLVLLIAGAATLLVGAWLGLNNGETDADRVLVVDESGAVSLIDTEAGTAEFTIQDAVVAPDRSRLYRTSPASGDTMVEELDPGTGEVTSSQRVRGKLKIRTVSPRGGAVALMPPRQSAGTIYQPEGRATTSITVVRSQGTGEARTYRLRGNYEPETFSTAETTLFLIEYYPPLAPEKYFVRQLDLDTGYVKDVYTPEVELQPDMRGVARSQVISPDGDFLYTLYSIGPDAEPVLDHHTAGPGKDRWAFVHALSLEEEWSLCIFLPVPFGTTDSSTYGLGISPDGRTLYAVDGATQLVVRIDAEDQQVVDFGAIAEITPNENRPLPVAVGSDGTLFVAANNLVVEVQPTLVAETGWWSEYSRIKALDVSPDGRQLRVALRDEVTIVDLGSGLQVATITVPGSVAFFGPPTSTELQQTSLVCAC